MWPSMLRKHLAEEWPPAGAMLPWRHRRIAYLQSLHMGFQSLKVQKGATEIYNHLKTITTRFGKHFDNIITLRKKLEEAMTVVDKFGTDARSISRTLENIKDPEQVEKAVQTENVEKFVERNKQLKN